MKHGILVITLACVAGLLMSSFALAAGQGKTMGGMDSMDKMDSMDSMDKMKNMEEMGSKEHMQVQNRTTTRELNAEQTREMQRLLTQQGYEIGNINGVIDQETMGALRLFQESERLTVTGLPNQETLRSLAPNTDQQEFFGLSPEFGEPY